MILFILFCDLFHYLQNFSYFYIIKYYNHRVEIRTIILRRACVYKYPHLDLNYVCIITCGFIECINSHKSYFSAIFLKNFSEYEIVF